MMKDPHVLEVAIFKVKASYEGNMQDLRTDLREVLKGFPGLLEFCGYSPLTDQQIFADIVKWDNLENAMAAAKAFEQGDPRFIPYIEAIETLTFMGHFCPEN